MARFIEDRRDASLFVMGSLENLLPRESVARDIAAALASLDFSAFEAAYRNDATGRPALDPRQLAGVWVLGLLRGLTSSVALAQRCHEDVELRWLLGDAPVEKSTLCEFRKRHLEALKTLSTQVLAAMARSGLLPSEDLVMDGTIIRAAASCEANVTRKRLKKRLERLEGVIAEKLEAEDAEAPSLEPLKRRKARLESAVEEMTALGLTKEEDRLTLTEPEASLKKLKKGAFGPAHNVQVVSDPVSGAIVTVTVVDQANDQGQLEPQVEGALEELARVARLVEDLPGAAPVTVSRVGADGAYHDTLQLKNLAEHGVAAVVPNGQALRRAPGVTAGFEAEAFIHDPATDTLTCPQGQRLLRAGFNGGQTAARYRATARTCATCACKAGCCPKAQARGRTVHRPLYPEVVEAVAKRVESPEGKALLRARSVTCEGNFARFVERLHWRRCRTWGQAGAWAEGLWRQITHNLMLLTGCWEPLVLKAA